MKGNTDKNGKVLALIGNAKLVFSSIKDFIWYVPHFILDIAQGTLKGKNTFSRAPTQLSDIERSVSEKPVGTHSIWFLELGVQRGIDKLSSISAGFKNENPIDTEARNSAVFKGLHLNNAQCVFRTQSFPEKGINTEQANHIFFSSIRRACILF